LPNRGKFKKRGRVKPGCFNCDVYVNCVMYEGPINSTLRPYKGKLNWSPTSAKICQLIANLSVVLP